MVCLGLFYSISAFCSSFFVSVYYTIYSIYAFCLSPFWPSTHCSSFFVQFIIQFLCFLSLSNLVLIPFLGYKKWYLLSLFSFFDSVLFIVLPDSLSLAFCSSSFVSVQYISVFCLSAFFCLPSLCLLFIYLPFYFFEPPFCLFFSFSAFCLVCPFFINHFVSVLCT